MQNRLYSILPYYTPVFDNIKQFFQKSFSFFNYFFCFLQNLSFYADFSFKISNILMIIIPEKERPPHEGLSLCPYFVNPNPVFRSAKSAGFQTIPIPIPQSHFHHDAAAEPEDKVFSEVRQCSSICPDGNRLCKHFPL